MTEGLIFRRAAEYEPGTVYTILAQCYADILDTTLRDSLREFDQQVFAAPDTVGACALISSVSDEIVGFLSYDPRQGPEVGIIGHNGVLPAFQQRGYGTQQILEILRLFTSARFTRARVSTSEHPFFAPARKVYEKCGFRQCGTTPDDRWGPYAIVHYEKPLVP
jgi:RimJ/RimL family protein N-acetyltransferase